jgi:predicted RNA-binding protein YlxR (DUF448 family)
MSNAGHNPQRTCLGCRDKKDKKNLIRFVLIDNIVHVDPDHKRPGRGAYVCANENCLQTTLKSKAFYRAFRREVQIHAEDLMKDFSECLKKK